jgi:hypothetical protein
LTSRTILARNVIAIVLIEAPKLDAIDGIVNMPRSLRDLRFGPIPWSEGVR